MSTKTYTGTNPTANLFELLQVDELPEKRTSNKSGQAKKPADGPTLETPAEKGQRRKAAEAQKAAAAAAERQRRDAEEAMAASFPQEGFQVQKGSATKKPAEAKPKAMKREDFEVQESKPKEPKQFRGPGNPKKFDGTGKPDGAKTYNTDKRQNTQPSNRPPRHEGYDKHSGGKTTNKPPVKRKGEGAGNWGNDASVATTGAWPEDVVTTPSATDGTGWGDEGEKKAEKSANTQRGWGDEGDKKPEKDTKEGEPKDEKDKKPAWDDEGYGKMTLEEFQKTVALEREKKLAALQVGVKGPGRQIEQTVDLSKCSYRDTTDQKEQKFAEDRKKEIAEKKKQAGTQQRPGEKNVDLSAFIDVRTRGGRGGRGGGRGGDRPPRAEGSPEQPAGESRPNRGGRGGRGGGGGNRVPTSKNAFPDLPAPSAPVANVAKAATQTPPATGSPKSTK